MLQLSPTESSPDRRIAPPGVACDAGRRRSARGTSGLGGSLAKATFLGWRSSPSKNAARLRQLINDMDDLVSISQSKDWAEASWLVAQHAIGDPGSSGRR